jgi:hypothetical protein
MQSKNIPNPTLDFQLILVAVLDGICRQSTSSTPDQWLQVLEIAFFFFDEDMYIDKLKGSRF